MTFGLTLIGMSDTNLMWCMTVFDCPGMSEKVVEYDFIKFIICRRGSVVMVGQIFCMSLYVDFDTVVGSKISIVSCSESSSFTTVLASWIASAIATLMSCLMIGWWWCCCTLGYVSLGFLRFIKFRKHVDIESFMFTLNGNQVNRHPTPF